MSTVATRFFAKDMDVEPNPDHLIGAILVGAGRLTADTRDHILDFQKKRDLLFCEAGLQLGLLEREDIRFALSEQLEHDGGRTRQSPVSREVLAVHQPDNPCVEAMRTLRSQLTLRWQDRAPDGKCLAVVGVEERVGRSFIIANLAALFSQLGQRTLLIDANMRAPRVHSIFNLNNWPGLSSILTDQADNSAITHISAVDGLSVLPAGPTPSNPQELLSGQKFRMVIETAARNYDIVLLDTPAWKCGADAQIVSSRTGAALLVTRSARSLVQPTVALVDMLNQSGAQVLGAVMNQL